MAQAAETIAPAPTVIRRFELPDLDRHGFWLLPRLYRAYPHLDQRTVIGWLRGILYVSEFKFLFGDHSVGLAQLDRGETLNPKAFVRERFVFVQELENAEHVAEAALMYPEFARWGRQLGCERMIVDEKTDVPVDQIKVALGTSRVINVAMTVVNLGKE